MKNKIILILSFVLSTVSYAKNTKVDNDLTQERPLSLLKLIVKSESIVDSEKEFWINVMPSMSNEQKKTLYNILNNEQEILKNLSENLNAPDTERLKALGGFVKHFDSNNFDFEVLADYKNLVNAKADDSIIKNFISYQAVNKKEIYYFDKEWKLSKTEVKDGFYREVLGKTEQGNLVVQDFYQKNKSPHTAPFVIKKGGDVKSTSLFEIDGRKVWFNEDKSLSRATFITLINNARTITSEAIYEKGKLVAVRIGANTYLLYDKGKIIAVIYNHTNLHYPELSFFREDGSLFAQVFIVGDNRNNLLTAKYYDENTNKIDKNQDNEQTLKSLLDRYNNVIQHIITRTYYN